MTTQRQELFSSKDKVNILLHEYDKLCQGIQNLTNNGYKLLISAGVPGFIWWTTQQKIDYRFWVAVCVATFLLSIGGLKIFLEIHRAATRLRELEHDINIRAKEELLVWESKWGGDVTGYLVAAKPLRDKAKQIERK